LGRELLLGVFPDLPGQLDRCLTWLHLLLEQDLLYGQGLPVLGQMGV
jgi:hypothetical protein